MIYFVFNQIIYKTENSNNNYNMLTKAILRLHVYITSPFDLRLKYVWPDEDFSRNKDCTLYFYIFIYSTSR